MQGLARIIQEQLALSPEEMGALQETMQSFREDRQTLAMEQASLRHRLRDPALGQITDDEAREILSGLVKAQEEELALYKKEQEALLKVLSPGQLVQFYRIRDEWGQRIQQMRQRRGPGGPPGGEFLETIGSGGVAEGSYGFPAPGARMEGWILR
jgi:regulator of replication initiation timing